MSKYLGKLLLEAGIVKEKDLNLVSVKYMKKRNAFGFRHACGTFYVGAEVVYGLASMRGYLECQYQWSVGYVVRPLKGIESLREMRNAELDLLGGRRELVLSGVLDSDDSFDYLCAIQYLYKFSEDFFKRVKGHAKRNSREWIEMRRKSGRTGGRKKGSKNLDKALVPEETETLEEMLARCEHNMNAGLAKGFYSWFEEGYKDKCRIQGRRFDKKKCLDLWNELRRECD